MPVQGMQRIWVECDLCGDEMPPWAPRHVVLIAHQRAAALGPGPGKALLCDACLRAVTLYAHSGERRQVQREADADFSHTDGGKWFLTPADAQRCSEAQRPVRVGSEVKEDG